MCGIFGEVGKHKTSEETFRELNNLNTKRGPDSEGYWTDNDLCRLGFRRLAILDLSTEGNQPMTSLNGEWIMVMNGEVYNYKELYKELGSPVLRSHTDTEVVVNIFERFGVDEGVKKLNGMFAIGLYHTTHKTLYLIRDFAGIKPLYFGIKNGNCVFASQFNQLFKHPIFVKELNLRIDIMKEYFGLGYMHAPNTVFEDIYQLSPGEYLKWDAAKGEIISKIVYANWTESPVNDESAKSTVDACNNLLTKIVHDQLQSDVPLGTFLSGGIDSPLVTAHAVKQHPLIQSYTFGVDEPTLNEAKIAASYAEILNVKHITEYTTDDELQQTINSHFKNIPEPHGDYSSIPTYLITQKAKHFATVMLSGDGGDELFWGYPRFIKSVEQAKWFGIPLALRKIVMPIFRRLNPNLSYALSTKSSFGEWILHKQIHFNELNALFPDCDFSDELKATYACKHPSKKDALLFLKRNEFWGHLQKILRKVDLMSMANSLEVRVPLLDKRMIEFSNTLNPGLGIKHVNPKVLLKKCLSQFIPESLIEKQKKGFTVPIESWLKGPLKQDIQDLLLHKPIYGFTNQRASFLQAEITRFYQNDTKVNPWGIWHAYAWQKWAIENQLIKN